MKIKRITFILIFFIFVLNINSLLARQQLSSQAKISLLTCAPGEELYSLFGHSAIRVQDPINRIDLVFNYGIFDFDTPNFMLKFVRGKLLYKLGLEDFRQFKNQYRREKRKFIEQTFDLTVTQKQDFYNFLKNNARPENAEYKYDFFYDNCASRIRDVAKKVLGNDLKFEAPVDFQPITFRQNLDYYLSGQHKLGFQNQHPWTDFGMDLILGMPADRLADFQQEMFLPETLAENLSFGNLSPSGKLLLAHRTLSNAPPPRPEPIPWSYPSPSLVFWLLCGASVFLLPAYRSDRLEKFRNKIFARFFDAILFFALGLSGCLFVFMWVATDHEACYQNLNMLWANPFHILLIINVLRKKITSFWKKYLWVTLGINLILVLCIFVQQLGFRLLPQEFHIVILPILLIISMRVASILKSADATQPVAKF